MTKQAFADEAVLGGVSGSVSASLRIRSAIKHYWHWAAAVALAILLWAPRLSGPIDLRWDGGVYYILGTSLATGHGYRILSEPGSPEALQYPPLLPAIVALYQRVLGSTDPAIVAPWLRISYAALFLIYALAVLALARKYLRPVFALAATALCLLHIWTLFLSDLLFAEAPFALISVVFALVITSDRSLLPRPWLRETASFALAVAGFFLRTAGVVLFAAWALEALARRCWRLAMLRAVIAVLPVALWQMHVERVRRSDEYRHPAYEYQRAAYQHYNVTYAENMSLVDPFRPERGVTTKIQFAARVIRNFVQMPSHLGQAISAPREFWQSALRYHRLYLPKSFVLLPILGLGGLIVGGVVQLIRCRVWTVANIVILSVALICLTPWPEEFHRYLAPVAPFLTIAALLCLDRVYLTLRMRASRTTFVFTRAALASFIVLVLVVQTRTDVRMMYQGSSTASASAAGAHFFYDRDWTIWEQAVAWIGAHAASVDVVATAAPHQAYLRTGLRAVYPPFTADPIRACRQLESVPVKYVVIDQFKYRDFTRQYALPAVESDRGSWRLVHINDAVSIYEYTASPR